MTLHYHINRLSHHISTHILTRRMTTHILSRCNITLISTHILTRRMTILSILPRYWWTFQLTSSRGGWRQRREDSERNDPFQLTSSRGGWRFLQTYFSLRLHFNSHPHEEDDCHAVTISNSVSVFQLTSSRGGWRGDGWVFERTYNISTHILTRRMTTAVEILCLLQRISTHILTRRMTTALEILCLLQGISTHILTRRMTASVDNWSFISLFQLTSSRGGWRCF